MTTTTPTPTVETLPRGSLIGRRAWFIVIGWAVALACLTFLSVDALGRLAATTGMDESSESYRAYELTHENFAGAIPDLTVMYSSDTMTVDDPEFKLAVDRAVAALPPTYAERVQNGLDQLREGPGLGPSDPSLISADRRAVKVLIGLPVTDDPTRLLSDYNALLPHLNTPHDAVAASVKGAAVTGKDFLEISARDTIRAEMIALPIVFLLSIFIFKGLVAALLPTLIGGAAIVVSFATLRAVTTVTDVASTSLMVVTLLGLGLAIDYCLFVIGRFREELGSARGRAAAEAAIARTLPTAGRTVLFSALVLAASLIGLVVFPVSTVRSVAYAAIPAVVGGAFAATTLLPALLVILGHRVNALRIAPFAKRGRRAQPNEPNSIWGWFALRVMRRPLLYLLTTSVVLVSLALPFGHVRWGGVDERLLPPNSAARVATQVQEGRFGGGQVWATVVLTDVTEAAAKRYVERLSQVERVDVVEHMAMKTSGNGAARMLYAIGWKGEPYSMESRELIQRLRDQPVEGGQRYVGGPTATTIDTVSALTQRVPAMLAVIVIAMLLVLGLAFRSVAIPIKAVVVSTVSMGASLGAMTLVFQDGHGARFLGFVAPGYLEMSMPLIMMAIVFGLSMDYEVFMLSRIREEWLRTGDTTHSVAFGLMKTGGLITSAALLLAVVIGGFATSGIIAIKMLGVGMLVAVLLDATVVRGILVPATMRLLGQWNWWPSRRIIRLDAHASDTLPDAASGSSAPSAKAPADVVDAGTSVAASNLLPAQGHAGLIAQQEFSKR